MTLTTLPRRFVFALLVLTACGGGDNSTGTPTNPGGPNNPAPTPVASVGIDRTSVTLVVGAISQLSATMRSAAGAVLTGRAVSWTSSAAAVATVSIDGLVTGIAPGAATITATSEGQSASASITVTPVPVSTVSLSVSSASVQVGATTTITAQARSADGTLLTGRAATWSSSNVSVATVNAGVVTGVSSGTATISVSVEGVNGTAQVTVVPVPVATLQLAPTSLTLVAGSTGTMVATARDASGATLGGRVITWSSSAPSVATVANGVVTAIAPGSATITATSEGVAANAGVTVTPVPVASLIVTPTLDSLAVGAMRTLVATPRDAVGNVLSGRLLTWSSSAISIATVQNGVVTAVAPGTASIVVTSEGQSASATIVVRAVASVEPRDMRIAPGLQQTCALVGSSAWCWGRGTLGGLGNGTTVETQLTPVLVSGGHQFVALAAGSNSNCALDVLGAAWCWGWSADGALGNGNGTVDQSTPVAVSGGLRFTQIAAGGGRTVCAISSAGPTYCWGSNTQGALGASTGAASSLVPIVVAGNHQFRQIAVSEFSACGLTAAGVAYCWGWGQFGQLGNGGTASSPAPVAVSGGHQFVEVGAGYAHNCARKANGTVWCWGNGTSVGATTDQRTPIQIGGDRSYVALGVGGPTSCAMTTSGAAWCWGGGGGGNLGNGSTDNSLPAVPVSGGHIFTQLVGGPNSRCGRTATALYCWGFNGFGKLGDGSTANGLVPVRVNGLP